MAVANDLDTKKEHILIGKTLHGLESSALNFSARAIPDAAARLKYMQATYDYSKELLDGIDQGKLTVRQAAEQANEMRNLIMEATRGKSCEVAQAYAFKKKPTGTSLPHLQEKYSKRFYGKKRKDRDSHTIFNLFCIHGLDVCNRPNGIDRYRLGYPVCFGLRPDFMLGKQSDVDWPTKRLTLSCTIRLNLIYSLVAGTPEK